MDGISQKKCYFFGINPSTFTIESQTNNKNNSIIEGQQIVVISASGGGESGLPLVDLSSLPITIDVIKTTTSIEIKGHFWPNASLAGHDVPIISKSQVVQEFLKKPYTYTYLIPGVCNLMCSRTNPNCCDTIPKQQKLRTTRLSQNNITISGLLVLIDTNDGWNATIRLAYRVLVGGYDVNTYLDGKVISSPVIPMKTYIIDANTGEILYSS